MPFNCRAREKSRNSRSSSRAEIAQQLEIEKTFQMIHDIAETRTKKIRKFE